MRIVVGHKWLKSDFLVRLNLGWRHLKPTETREHTPIRYIASTNSIYFLKNPFLAMYALDCRQP